ncbi:MAG TPA: GPW/gp25 family protein [Puia sp.]|nr:GPW/gp25 family protein [Puia sp.]
MANYPSFLGTGWSFPPSFDNVSGTVNLVKDVDDINQSLNILLSTTLGERVMQPNYGCNLENYLFEPLNNTLIGFIRDLVTKAILYYEPRIVTESVEVTAADSAELWEGRFTILVTYSIPQTNSRFNYVYDYYSNEALAAI